MQSTQASSLRGNGIRVDYETDPDQCPICHRSVSPKFVAAAYTAEEAGHEADLIWQCTSSRCAHVFIAVYRHIFGGGNKHQLVRVWPRTAKRATFSDEIAAISPTFVEIYNQVSEAEAAELDQVVDIGLRKALEFLVKDFAIHQRKEEEAKIRKTFLGNVINDFVDDPNAKAAAKRAAWLGNDEAHYVRRWEEKDVVDLKRLIRLTANWIENVILTEKYVEEMPE